MEKLHSYPAQQDSGMQFLILCCDSVLLFLPFLAQSFIV